MRILQNAAVVFPVIGIGVAGVRLQGLEYRVVDRLYCLSPRSVASLQPC